MEEDVNNLSHYQAHSRLHFIGSWKPKATEELKKWWSHYSPNNEYNSDSDVPEAPWMLPVFKAFRFGSSTNAMEHMCLPFPALAPFERLINNNIELSVNELKVFVHIDMDAFFCSVTLSKPEFSHLLNEPVAVAAGKEHSEISSCNYIARKCGVKAGMWVSDARREICPKLKTVPYDLPRCTAIAIDVYRIIYESCPSVRVVYNPSDDEISHEEVIAPVKFSLDVVSIDDTIVTFEWPRDEEGKLCLFCDSSNLIPTIGDIKEWAGRILYSAAVDFCKKVKWNVQTRTNGCTASFGIGSSYIISRLSTAVVKPNGIACVLLSSMYQSHFANNDNICILEENEFIDSTLVADLFGVGSKTFEKLLECLPVSSENNTCNKQKNRHKKKQYQTTLVVGGHDDCGKALVVQNNSVLKGNSLIAEERACWVIWNSKRIVNGINAPDFVSEFNKKPGSDIITQLLKRKSELSRFAFPRKRTRALLFPGLQADKEEKGHIANVLRHGNDIEILDALKSLFKCTHLQCVPLVHLQKTLGDRKGNLLFCYCRGIDFHDVHSLAAPAHPHITAVFKSREAVASKLLQIALFDSRSNSSAQVGIKTLTSSMNYACRPKAPNDVSNILSQLLGDTCRKAGRVYDGHTSLTCQSVKVVFLERHPDYPKETTKYMGCGRCVEKTIMIKVFINSSDNDDLSSFSSFSVISRNVTKENFLNCSVLASRKMSKEPDELYSPLAFDAVLREDLLPQFQNTVTSLVMLACGSSLVDMHTDLQFSIIIDDIRGLSVSLCSLKATDEVTEGQPKLLETLRRRLFAFQNVKQRDDPIFVGSQSSDKENVGITSESVYPSIDAALKHVHLENPGLDDLSAIMILLRRVVTKSHTNTHDHLFCMIRDFICQGETLTQLQFVAKTTILLRRFASSWMGSYDLYAAITRAFEIEVLTLL